MKLSELRNKLASEWQNKGCIDGRMVLENVRTRWAATDFSEGFDAGAKAVMDEADKLAEALQKIRNGLTTDINRVEYETKKLAHEYLVDWNKFKEGNDEPG